MTNRADIREYSPIRRPLRSRWRGPVVLLASGAAAASVVLEPSSGQYPAIAVLEVLIIVGFATAGQLLAGDPTQRGNSRLLILTAALQTITHLHLVPNSPLPLLAWLSGPLSALPAAIVLLRFPGRRLDPLARKWAIFQGVWLIVSRLTFTVPTPERRLGWWPALPLSPSAASIASDIGNGVAILSTLFFAGLLARRIRNSRGLVRHEIVPVLVAAISASVAVTLHLVTVANSRSGVDPLVLGIEQFGLLTVPGAFMFSAVAMRLARAAVGDLLLRVDYSAKPDEIQSALRQTLSDPDLALHLTRDSPAAPSGPGQMRIPIRDQDGQLLAEIVTDSSIARHGDLLSATVAATQLALRNAAAVGELRQSRARIAEAGLRERKRLERDIHDGAQQRLLAVNISLGRLRRVAGDDTTRSLADAASHEIREAIREIRHLAQGLHPAVLTQCGLKAAVESAAERLPLRPQILIPDQRWPAATEATAYFFIAEALNNVVKHAGTAFVRVQVEDQGEQLFAQVCDDGRGGADRAAGSGLQGLADRVSALGGEVTLVSPEGGGTCLSAQIPYALP